MKVAKQRRKPNVVIWAMSVTPKDNVVQGEDGIDFKKSPFGDRRTGYIVSSKTPNVILCGHRSEDYDKTAPTIVIADENYALVSGNFTRRTFNQFMRMKQGKSK